MMLLRSGKGITSEIGGADLTESETENRFDEKGALITMNNEVPQKVTTESESENKLDQRNINNNKMPNND